MQQIKLSDFSIEPIENSVKHEDISDEIYFANYNKYISASKLHKISPRRNGSMKNYYEPQPKEWKECFEIGTAIHACILEPETFRLHEKCGKPSAKLGAALDAIRKYRKKGYNIEDSINKGCTEVGYYNKQLSTRIKKLFTKENLKYYIKSLSFTEHDIVISDKKYDSVKACIDSVLNNQIIMNQLHPSDKFGEPVDYYCEDTIYKDYKITYKDRDIIIPFRGKIDHFSVDEDNKRLVLNDVKTSSEPLYNDWIDPGKHFDNFAYDMQLAIYMDALQSLAKELWGFDETWDVKCHIWAVHTESAFSRCYTINNEWLTKGKNTYEMCLKMVAYYELFGHDEEVEFID